MPPWLVPFLIRHILSDAAAIHRLALVCKRDLVSSARFHMACCHNRVGRRVNRQHIAIVTIWAVIRLWLVVPSGEREWIVNPRMDLWMFHDIYKIILSNYVQYLY